MKCLFSLLILLMLWSPSSVKAEITPFFSSINDVDFGTIMFLTGSCEIDYVTGELTNISGAMCPFESELGTPGAYVIFSNPNKQVSIRIITRVNTGDNFTFLPNGAFKVSGLPDVLIEPDTTQLINTGETGIINIKLGGRMTSIQERAPVSSYTFENTDGIDWFEVP